MRNKWVNFWEINDSEVARLLWDAFSHHTWVPEQNDWTASLQTPECWLFMLLALLYWIVTKILQSSLPIISQLPAVILSRLFETFFFFTKYLVRNKRSDGGILTKNNKICFSCEHLCAILCVHTHMCACMCYHVYWYVNTCVWLCKTLVSQEDRYYHVFLLAEKTKRVMYPFR